MPAEQDHLGENLSPRDELLRFLGTQDDPDAFIEALAFMDHIVTTLMMEFARRFPDHFHDWCQEHEIDVLAAQDVIHRNEEDDDA